VMELSRSGGLLVTFPDVDFLDNAFHAQALTPSGAPACQQSRNLFSRRYLHEWEWEDRFRRRKGMRLALTAYCNTSEVRSRALQFSAVALSFAAWAII
jgi:hypothetical protein